MPPPAVLPPRLGNEILWNSCALLFLLLLLYYYRYCRSKNLASGFLIQIQFHQLYFFNSLYLHISNTFMFIMNFIISITQKLFSISFRCTIYFCTLGEQSPKTLFKKSFVLAALRRGYHHSPRVTHCRCI